MNEKWVVVTTEHSGVFFGRVSGPADQKPSIVLEECRCAIRWTGKRGFLGLASHGPEVESRIGATAPRVLLYDITSVASCTNEAVKAWQSFS